MESGRFVARVKLIEKEMVPNQPLISVLRSKAHAVVVVPQRAERLIDIACARVGRENAGQDIRVVMIGPVPNLEKIAREAVAF